MEHLFAVPTDGIFADLNREQRELYRQIEQAVGGVLNYARYFTAEQLAQDPGPLHRHPQAIEAHLAVFATRGILIPVSRPRHDTTRAPFAACYRLPVNPSRSGREMDGADETPAEFDDIRLMTLERIRTTLTGGATSE
jgi:hypothetical protein